MLDKSLSIVFAFLEDIGFLKETEEKETQSTPIVHSQIQFSLFLFDRSKSKHCLEFSIQ